MAQALTVGELAERSGVATSALRYYEERGLIAAERTPAGHRRYPRAIIRRVAFIVFAQRVGMSLEEIGAELARLPDDRRARAGRLGPPLPGLAGAHRRADRRARAASREPGRMHRLRLPVARPLRARQPRRPRRPPRRGPALLAGRSPPGDGPGRWRSLPLGVDRAPVRGQGIRFEIRS